MVYNYDQFLTIELQILNNYILSMLIRITITKCILGDNIQGVSGSPVSWEHFFHSLMLYHENLRRDLPNPDAVQYRHPPLRGITQRELEGLTSFLQLLTKIISWV